MARFNTSGLDDVLKQMKSLGELAGATADRMLMEGAAVVKDAWMDSIMIKGLIDTGQMYVSVGYPRKPKTANDIRRIDIYPQGEDRRGVRNAEKAFINHYGSSSIPATHFVDDADRRSGPLVQAKYEQIWNDYLEGREK